MRGGWDLYALGKFFRPTAPVESVVATSRGGPLAEKDVEPDASKFTSVTSKLLPEEAIETSRDQDSDPSSSSILI